MAAAHALGQYFTTDISLKTKVYEFIENNPAVILEPSVGQGDLVSYISQSYECRFDMYEIDETIQMLPGINRDDIMFGDFMQQDINHKYNTIVGNPPYVRTSKGNLYIDFIQRCYTLLEPRGELIFIVPSDWFKLTCAAPLLHTMMQHGCFTHIYHPHDEKLFPGASIDVVVFRYCKDDLLPKKVIYNNKEMFVRDSDGLITFGEEAPADNTTTLSTYFDVYVGLVSGKERVYKNATLGNIDVLNGKNRVDKYIYVEKYPHENECINTALLAHREELIARRIRKFNDDNWFEWGAPRNIKTIRANMGRDCIYVCGLTRNVEIAFVDTVQYFGGSLIMLKPKKECDLHAVAAFLNSDEFKSNFMFSGRFKIGHRQLCNSHLPLDCL